jgi:IS30 family transposase
MVRSRTTHRGAGLTEKQDRFVRLIAQGVSNSEACRLVGIHRRTGTRWRLGRTILNTAGEPVHYPPVGIVAAPRERHARYLSLQKRMAIADLRREKKGVREIAAQIGRSPATVSRELRRNTDSAGRYQPHAADRRADERVPRPRKRRVLLDEGLRAVVNELLGKRWSPEQVAHELRVLFPDRPDRQLCAESIYQAIYDPDIPVSRPAKRRRRRRRRQVQGQERRGRLSGMTMIGDRPAEVEDRVEVGHWEGDCIKGAGNRSAVGTLVERHTRFLILVHLPDGRATAEAMQAALTATLGRLPAELRRTLTWDQGKELALHQQIAEQTGTKVFFCDAHSPWQRGSNENMNGLLRDYFPKGMDLHQVAPEELAWVAEEINDRPRKTLGWARPADLLADEGRIEATAVRSA